MLGDSIDVTLPDNPPASASGAGDNLTATFEQSVVSGIGFTVGGVLFGLILIWLGGANLGKKIKKVASYG